MLRRNILTSCLASSFLVFNYSGSVVDNQSVALSQSKPEIKYERQSIRQVKKFKPIPGAARRNNPKGLARKTRPKDGSTNRDEVFVDADGVKILPDGTNIYRDGTNVWSDGTTVYPDGTTVYPDGTTVYPDGTITTSDGTPVEIEQQVLSPSEGVSSQ
ncbi:MAG: hypothetical protein KA716_11935 [Gloeotrichia echinulata DEX184]|nr:hypothetical protein [Gloeotrichia echinulata DEX184]